MVTRRRKVAAGTGAAVAEALIPDPTGGEVPEHEREQEEAPPHEEAHEAPARDDGPGIGLASREAAWGAIVEDVVRIDVAGTYRRLRDELRLGDGAHAYGEIHAALDRAELNYHDAVLLARAAKLEQERVDREVQARLEILRTTARKELEAEKRAALEPKSKASPRATAEEVLDRVRANWPDEYSHRMRDGEEIHAARASCEGLVAAWASRAQTLRKMAERYVRA